MERGVTGYIFTIIDKRKQIIELDESPVRGLFLCKKNGVTVGRPEHPKKQGRIIDPTKE
jgi:hypothetical protein